MQNDFHVGDIIELKDGMTNGGCANMETDIKNKKVRYIRIQSINPDGDIADYDMLNAAKKYSGGYCCTLQSRYFQKVNPAKKQSMVTKITNIARKLLDGDTRDLIKAGFMDECLNITKDGENAIFANWLLTAANKKSLADDAREKIAEEEKKKKKNSFFGWTSPSASLQ